MLRSLMYKIQLLFAVVFSFIWSLSVMLVIGALVALLIFPSFAFAQTDEPAVVQVLEEMEENHNNRVLLIFGGFTLLILGTSTFQYLQARQRAKTDDERTRLTENYQNELVKMLQDANTRNAAERTLMTTTMLPARTFLEILAGAAAVLGTHTGSPLLNETADFLKDVTHTEEGEDLSVSIGTKDEKPPAAESVVPEEPWKGFSHA